MLTHDAWIYESEAIDKLGLITPADKQLLFLPLAHVFARVMELSMIRLGVPTALDGSADRMSENLIEVRPTFFAAVPRLFERALDRVLRESEDRGPAATVLFQQALRLGREISRRRQRGEELPRWMRLAQRVAEPLVYGPVKARFGGRIRFMVSGGAPLSREVAEAFHALDLLICEGYGLTESTAASTVNTPDDYAFGTVGRPLPGVELRIASDGEILLRGRGVMRGYWGQPDATAEVLDAEGWLHTGDIGRVRDSGHLEITDRKKDLIVTAQGKNVAPAHVQGLLRGACSLISQVHVHGDRRPFCSALITLREDELRRWAAAEGLPAGTFAELARRPEVRHRIQQSVDDVNHQLPPFERVRKIEVLDEDFTVENGLLTASLKPRRKEIEARWATVLEGFYEGQRARM
jgi:long-chain acyl-CoA synthetase